MGYELKRNKIGVVESYKDGEYMGVIITTGCTPEWEATLHEENVRVGKLIEKGLKAEPRDWSCYENRNSRR